MWMCSSTYLESSLTFSMALAPVVKLKDFQLWAQNSQFCCNFGRSCLCHASVPFVCLWGPCPKRRLCDTGGLCQPVLTWKRIFPSYKYHIFPIIQMKTTLALFGIGFRGFTLALLKETIFPWGRASSVNPASLRLF